MTKPDTMTDILLAYVHLLDQLFYQIEAERSALEANEMDRLKPMNIDKIETLKAVDHETKRFANSLPKEVNQGKNQSIERYLEQLGKTTKAPTLIHLWHQLNQKLDSCHRANQMNAKILQASQDKAHYHQGVYHAQQKAVQHRQHER